MSRRVLWVDAFTETPTGGNPCAVVFDAATMPPEARIAFTRETGLVECAFLVPSAQADFGVRYYMATGEIPMAGHPTIATVRALEYAGLLEGRDVITLEVGGGLVPVEIERRSGAPTRFTMVQMAPKFGHPHQAGQIARIYGLSPRHIAMLPQTVSIGGTAFCVTMLESHEVLRAARLDVAELEAYRNRADFMEPFLFALGGATPSGDTFGRLLMPPPLPPEDPFTGSATGCMAAYLWRKGVLKHPVFAAEQGHGIGRPGRAMVEVLGPPDMIRGIRVGGSAVVVMDGKLVI